MNDREIRRRIHHAMDARLSGMTGDPWLAQRVMGRTGNARKKKRLSAGMVLAIVLILVAVTAAAAVTFGLLYKRTVEMEGRSGRMEHWSTAEKTAFVDWMLEAGIRLESNAVAMIQDETLTESERGALAMEIITEYFPSRDGILTSVDVIAKEKGPIENWSLDDKAWLSELLAQYQPDEVAYGRNLLPQAGDLSQEEAEAVFFDHYEQTYGLTKQDFDLDSLTAFFGEQTFDSGSGPQKRRCWTFHITLNPGARQALATDVADAGAYIGADGTLIAATQLQSEPAWKTESDREIQNPYFFKIQNLYRFDQNWRPRMEALLAQGEPVEQSDLYHLLNNKRYGLPSEKDISRNEAYRIACGALGNLGDLPEGFMQYYRETREAYRIDDPQNPFYRFVFVRIWREAAMREKAIGLGLPAFLSVTVDAQTGKVIETTLSDMYADMDGFGM